MKKTLWMIAVLVIVGLVSGAGLSITYKYTMPLIEDNKVKELERSIYTIIPEMARYERIEKDNLVIYKGIKSDGSTAGYAFTSKGGGYQGDISMMVGIDENLEKLLGLEILESVETPGLGGKITNKEFKGQFKGVSVLKKIEYVKNQKPSKANEVEAITGATVSSNSVVNILNGGISKAREILKK